MRLAGHELKVLNASVVLYVLAGALLFHSLDEFVDWQPAKVQPQQLANDKLDANRMKDVRPGDSEPVVPLRGRELRRLRADSVRRMWNITNQLNILYESNWTELVLAELVQFERRLLESLELTTGQPRASNANHQDDKQNQDESQETDSEDDGHNKKRARKKRTRLQLESEARSRSIKRSLVHSLATITTMSSPGTPEPRSSRGKLLTILYGSLGIPLLLLSLAKSGHHLARSSLNLLLLLRHYCVALPLHYLCCSCNLFTCLRALGWCCCCCCCSYLCCLDNDKQKCCDDSRAPKLKLAPKTIGATPANQKASRSPRRKRNSTQQLSTSASGDTSNTSTSFVIGFNVAPDNIEAEQQNQRAKSVRFSASGNQLQQPAQVEQRLIGANEDYKDQADVDDENDNDNDNDNNDDEEEQEQASYYSTGVFITAICILMVYISIGAFYLARTQQLSLTDALFACYAMLAANKLPEVFRLDAAEPGASSPSDPFQYYKSISGLESQPEVTSSSANLTERARAPSGELFARGSFESLTLDALYLLIGLNLISTCAHFARLWLRRAAGSRRGRQRGAGSAAQKSQQQQQVPQSNGWGPPGAPHSLAGHYSEFAPNPFGMGAPSSQQPATPASAHSPPTHMHQVALGASPQAGGSTAYTTSASGQIDLAELFVMNQNQNQNQPLHSDGSMTSDRSSSTAAKSSLCAHHQSTLGLQVQSSGAYQSTINGDAHLQLASNGRHQHPPSTDESGQMTDRMLRASCATLRPQLANGAAPRGLRNSSSSLQLGAPLVNGFGGGGAASDCASINSMPRGVRNQICYHTAHQSNQNVDNQSQNNNNDSSPNTHDTNSQTMSSLSSRAIVMKPPLASRQAHEQHVNLGPEKIIWFSDQSPNCN